MKYVGLLLVLIAAHSGAFNLGDARSKVTRRDIMDSLGGIMGATLISSAVPATALASGGATAGKYT
jgi:hypothetical protein